VSGDPPTVADLRAAIARELPDVAPHLRHAAVGMGADLYSDEAILRTGEEISLLPPVSGG
jgi:molybdopterin converting factor small subunit